MVPSVRLRSSARTDKCWRLCSCGRVFEERAGSSFCGKNKKNGAEVCKSFDHIGNFEEWVFIEILVSTFGFEKFEKGPSKLAVV